MGQYRGKHSYCPIIRHSGVIDVLIVNQESIYHDIVPLLDIAGLDVLIVNQESEAK